MLPVLLLKPMPTTNKAMVSSTITGKSRAMMDGSTAAGAIRPATPTTPKVLNRLDPKILPSAIACCCFRTATTLDTSSGSEVPMATTVRPTTKSLTPKLFAIFSAPHTKARELAIITNKPAPTNSQARLADIWCSCASTAAAWDIASSLVAMLWRTSHHITAANVAIKTKASNKLS